MYYLDRATVACATCPFLPDEDCGASVVVIAAILVYLLPTVLVTIPYADDGASFLNGSYHPTMTALTIIFAVGAISFLVLVRVIDPGYVDVTIAPAPVDTAATTWTPATRTVGGADEEYCRQCCGWRPARAGHCSTCGRCVERFDHHCPVIGACIGRLNHRFFAAMLACIALGSVCCAVADMIWCAAIPIWSRSAYSGYAPYVAIFIFVCSLVWITLAPFAIFHCAMVAYDMTTRETYGRQQKVWTYHDPVLVVWRRVAVTVCCAPIRCKPKKKSADEIHRRSLTRDAMQPQPLSALAIPQANAQTISLTVTAPVTHERDCDLDDTRAPVSTSAPVPASAGSMVK